MMRSSLLWLSERQSIFNFVRRNRLAKHFASRFVAGEEIVTAVAASVALRDRGINSTLDLLGESVSDLGQVDHARDTYLRILDAMEGAGVEVNASVKLTQMGFDLDETRCEENLRQILDRARELNGFVRLDMESSEYTQRTLDFHSRLAADFAAHTGVVLQSSLRRTTNDVSSMIAAGTRVRLCKGAYMEPDEVAFPKKSDVDQQYVDCMELLLTAGNYPGLATHDEVILERAQKFASERDIPPEQFEFQMLYGVRRDLQDALVKDGWRVRVYIPFGTQWYPYLMRRLAERPANIAFILGSVVREAVSRK